MPIYKRIDEIDKAYLQSLVDDEVAEDRGIEYKRDLNILKDLPDRKMKDEKRKLCGEISAFANADGGYLIVGIADDKGMPQKEGLCGIDKPDDFDQLKLKIQGIIDRGIEPQLFGVDMAQVELDEEKVALLIYVPTSWSKPHWVGEKGCRTFYTRTSGGKDHLDIRNVRELFVLSETALNRFRTFRKSRISLIEKDSLAAHIDDGLKIVLHVVPFQAIGLNQQLDLSALTHPFGDRGIRRPYSDFRFNFEGIYSAPLSTEGSHCYQIFRSGTFEFVFHIMHSNEEEFFAPFIGQVIFEEYLPRTAAWGETLKVSPPYFFLLSILHVRGLKLTMTHPGRNDFYRIGRAPSELRAIRDKDHLLATEIRIDNDLQDQALLMQHMRPALDAVWQASGWPAAKGYDEDGKWIGVNSIL